MTRDRAAEQTSPAQRTVAHSRYSGAMVASTSFRLSAIVKQELAERALVDGLSVTALLERLIIEGLRGLDHPGVTFRGQGHDRRAALAAGPDVWEVVARLRELDGPEERRVREFADESGIHPRLVRTALDYAAAHAAEIRERIARNEKMIEQSQLAAQQREALLR